MNVKSWSKALTLLLVASVCTFSVNAADTNDAAIAMMQQQTKKISGTVTDNAGEPVIGANIVLKSNRSVGAITDIDGKYTLDVPAGAVLVVSYVGYTTKEVAVGSQNVVNVNLVEDSQQLDEVVVVGYGVQRKSDVTGSIAIADAKDLLRTPSFSAIQGLKGIAPGVNVFINSGMPGGGTRVVIRGRSSIQAAGEPLYVVDGVVMEDFQFVNPNDIERMEVLKDASATAIYGARGANGVIMVTTKRGGTQEGKATVSYSGWVSASIMGRKMKTLTGDEWMKAYRIGMQNAERFGGKSASELNARWTNISMNNPANPQFQPLFRIDGAFNPEGWRNADDKNLVNLYNTDWQKESTRTAISHNHQLNIQQGGKNSSVGAFLNYTDQQGIVNNTYMKRLNAKLTYDAKPTPWLSTGVNLMVNHTWQRETQIGSGGMDAIRMIIEMPTIIPVKYPDGGWSSTSSSIGSSRSINGFGFEAAPNPVHFLDQRNYMAYRTQIFGNAALTFHLMDGLDLKTQFGVDAQMRRWRRHQPFGLVNQDNGGKGWVGLSFDDILYWQEETFLTYNKVFGKHRVNGVLGLSWTERVNRNMGSSSGNFTTNAFGFDNIGAGSEPNTPSSSYGRWAMNSYFFRGGYTYDDKYMATVTARVDGSSRFGANNKYALFPSLGLGWMISNEDFMKDITWIDQLKLHSSFGVTGNSEIGQFNSLSTYSFGTTLIGGARVPSASPTRLSNPDLRWEKTSQFDVGFNLNMFKNRLNFDVSYYYKYTDDLLLSAPIPASSGYNSIMRNIGAVSNQGVDAMVTFVPVQTKDFEWNSTINFNYNSNKVERLANNNADLTTDSWLGGDVIMRVGEPLGSIYILNRVGIKGEAFVAQYGGRVGTALRNNNLPRLDGESDEAFNKRRGKQLQGPSVPPVQGSWINKFYYKNFDLTVDLQFTLGGKINQRFYHSGEDRFGLTGGLASILHDAWSPGKPTDVPDQVQAVRLASFDGQDSTMDSRWLASASYLRGNLFQLGYNFDKGVTNALRLSALRAYVSVENAFAIYSSKFQGYDGEGTTTGNVFSQNQSFFQYPRPTVFTLGANVTF